MSQELKINTNTYNQSFWNFRFKKDSKVLTTVSYTQNELNK